MRSFFLYLQSATLPEVRTYFDVCFSPDKDDLAHGCLRYLIGPHGHEWAWSYLYESFGPYQELEPEQIDTIATALGGPPAVYIHVNVTGRIHAHQETVDLARELLTLWPGVAFDDSFSHPWRLHELGHPNLRGELFFQPRYDRPGE